MGERPVIPLASAGRGDVVQHRSSVVVLLWIVVERLLVTNSLQLSSRLRITALRTFGARVGRGVVVRPRLRVKFPWLLTIGDDCWIGEGVWFHNQDRVTVGDNCVVSQESFITTGSHEMVRTMDLVTAPVALESGCWVTSRCVVLSGVTVGRNSVLLPGSVAAKDVPADLVCGGVPAKPIKKRDGGALDALQLWPSPADL